MVTESQQRGRLSAALISAAQTIEAMGITRPRIMFLAGLCLTINESLTKNIERPYFLAFYGGMMGIPLFVSRKDVQEPPSTRTSSTPNSEVR